MASEPPPSGSHWFHWAGWVFGLLALLALIAVVVQLGEIEHFLILLRALSAPWLLLALLLQFCTYASVAVAWQYGLRQVDSPLSLRELLPLVVAKLFVDQAAPTGGISGTAFLVTALARHRVSTPACLAVLLAILVAHYSASLLAALAGVGLLAIEHQSRPWMVSVFALFALVSVAIPMGVLALRWYGRREPPWLLRFPGAAPLMKATTKAPLTLVRRPEVLLTMAGLSLAVVLLDVATLWLMLHALGLHTPYRIAFTSFLLAMMVTTIGPIPLGLGSFEATCVTAQVLQGLPIEGALTATLLLRGYTTWMPMLPGLFLTRRELRASRTAQPS